jgi:hypothetical protein
MALGVVVLALALTSTAGAQPATTALAAVARIYQDFAAEAVIDTPELTIVDLFGRPTSALARYLDDDLVALVLADRECARRTQGVCALDFAPIWDAQDPIGATVKIAAGADPSRVTVALRYPGNVVRRLTYVMTKTPAGWRVHDIEYDSHPSLVALLKGKA